MNDSEIQSPRQHTGGPRSRVLLWLAGAVVLLVALLWGRHQLFPPAAVGPAAEPVAREDRASRGASLEEALRIAREGLEAMNATLRGYRGRLVKQERVNDRLMPENEMAFKIRPRRGDDPSEPGYQPMAVYLRFLRPESAAGREVIWVEDRNDGKLYAHEGGMLNVLSVSLEPTSMLAMRGNRYPITQVGFKNLVRQLIERGRQIERLGSAEVTFIEDYRVGGVPCLLIQVRPQIPKDLAEGSPIDFSLAEIAIDTERQIPLRYAAYGEPLIPGDPPPLLEEYTYHDVQLNPGLTDADFDPSNPEYEYR